MAKKKRPNKYEIKHRERLELYMRGMSDKEIVKRLKNISLGGLRLWRDRNKLPENEVRCCIECGKTMQGKWLKKGDIHDLYRFWKCPECGGEFWPAEETEKKEAG